MSRNISDFFVNNRPYITDGRFRLKIFEWRPRISHHSVYPRPIRETDDAIDAYRFQTSGGIREGLCPAVGVLRYGWYDDDDEAATQHRNFQGKQLAIVPQSVWPAWELWPKRSRYERSLPSSRTIGQDRISWFDDDEAIGGLISFEIFNFDMAI